MIFAIYQALAYDVASGSDITPINSWWITDFAKRYEKTFIKTSRNYSKFLTFSRHKMRFQSNLSVML